MAHVEPPLAGQKSRLCKHVTTTNELCGGPRDQMELVISMPVILVFDTVEDRENPLPWTFPRCIEVPGETASGVRKIVHYDIVARAIHNDNHFFAYVQYGMDYCYVYNDLDGGMLQRQSQRNSVDLLIAGKIEDGNGMKTNAVMYYLREGTTGQDLIARRIRRRLSDKLDMSFNLTADDGIPRVTLTGKGEVLVRRADNRSKYDEYETQLNANTTTDDAAGSPVKTKTMDLPSAQRPLAKRNPKKRLQVVTISLAADKGTPDHNANLVTDKSKTRSIKDSKPWPFSPIELSDMETDLLSIHSDHTSIGGPVQETGQRSKLSRRQSQASSEHANASAMNEFRCRCGFQGTVRDEDLDQNIIQCDALGYDAECLWSHRACQIDGWTEMTGHKDTFHCPLCEPIDWDKETGYGTFFQMERVIIDMFM